MEMKRRVEHATSNEVEQCPEALKISNFSGLWSFFRNHRKLFYLSVLCLCTFLAVWAPTLQRNHHVAEDRVAAMNAELMEKSPQEILQWAAKTMPKGGVIQFSSFGPSGMVIIDMLNELGLLEETPVVMIDTLHLFPESYEHVLNVTKRYPKMKLSIIYPKGYQKSQEASFDETYGKDLWKENFQRYSYLTKVEPTERALQMLKPHAWITGRRRSQGHLREKLQLVEKDAGRVKINPLAYWNLKDVWKYIEEHHVPYNALHDRGYSSIGDVMNTRPINPGEAERAGRFSSSKETECGMHTHLTRLRAAKRQVGAPVDDDAPHLLCDACLEVDNLNFEELVLKTKQDLLLEFYSPMCGHCTHFAPSYAQIAQQLGKNGDAVAARMDLYHYELPKSAKDAGFEIAGFPTLILVRPTKKNLKLIAYPHWRRNVESILAWVKEEVAKPIP
eukprot:symbB.v1.2.024590.t1/scaffold2338.1/size81926/3